MLCVDPPVGPVHVPPELAREIPEHHISQWVKGQVSYR